MAVAGLCRSLCLLLLQPLEGAALHAAEHRLRHMVPLGIVAAMLLSILLFREHLTPAGIAGIALVVVSVAVLNLWGGAGH